MTIVLDERADSSIAVYIDGDLQFDSRDEGLYHELLALPALALATARRSARGKPKLRALICGGGDGLAARELLKSAVISHVDLVDYDAQIIALARDDWAAINGHALSDARLHVHVEDAFQFVDRAARLHRAYDLIICDFTVPRDSAGARLHTIEWYGQLRAILADTGVLAVNAASPSQTPLAYWSIYNSLRAAELHPRPYRFVLPSFTNAGYGDDWGFFIGAARHLRPREFSELRFAEPRQFLHSADQLRRCFCFPSAIAKLRDSAPPTSMGSLWLLQALFNPTWEDASAVDWSALDWSHDPAELPATDSAAPVLPYAVRATLQQAEPTVSETEVFEQVIEVMPALRADQTRSMIREFIDNPARFLNTLDLRAIVDALLRRAAELPQRLVGELRLLRANLRRTWSNPHSLLQRGLRIVSIIAIVVILSNIIHPDAAYGKGSVDGGTTSGAYQSGSFARTSSPYDVVAPPPSTVSGPGFAPSRYGRGVVVDEVGSYYPTRRYRYYRSYYGGSSYRSYSRPARPDDPNEGEALYRLTPETDLLANGEIVIALTDQSYLLLADQVTSVVDINTGLPIIFLQRDPALIWRTHQELNRQRTGLRDSVKGKQDWIDWISWMGFAPWRDDDERELANMQNTVDVVNKAIASLGSVPAQQPPVAEPPLSGSYQLFTGVWVTGDGSMAIIQRADAQPAYLDRNGWWLDPGRTAPISDPYPDDLRKLVLVPFLTKLVNEYDAVKKSIESDLASARQDMTSLQKDLAEYTQIQKTYGPSDTVEYGSSEISVSQALQLTNADIGRTDQLISVLQQRVDQLPKQHEAAQKLLAVLR